MGKSLRTYHTFVLLDLPDIGNLISQQEGLLKVNLLRHHQSDEYLAILEPHFGCMAH